MFDRIVAILAPHRCIGCGVEGGLWCEGCRLLAALAVERCYRCQRLMPGGRTCTACRPGSALFSVRAATAYDGFAKSLMWRLKFDGARDGASVAARMMVARLSLPEYTVVVYVPAATSHIRRRGYDQARLIAWCLARHTQSRMLPALMRVGQEQQRDATRQQRLRQLRDAFRVIRPETVLGVHILLVDDVITTGATLEAAAAVLKAAGARRVEAVVFAQA